MSMMPMPYDDTAYHVKALADSIAEGHPDVQRVRQEAHKTMMAAVNQAKGMPMRQNRSSADKYPMPLVNENTNPMGIAKKGKK